MNIKTGSSLVVSILAIAALWAAPVEAEAVVETQAQEETCFEAWSSCAAAANAESDEWVRANYRDYCTSYFGYCAGLTGCGDGFCDTYQNWESHQSCPDDCP
ncbi:hypothetical protein [Pyxidicoccus caerfyrddinensis]|uniref:hypothetical protein n=1 Tax=Pyxidicoccus caerfyrddinensis TaxID=2709663 RepID=UPI0013DC0BDB|nr:hypothetical protein [Pyxidicoccus caerfyrddinensis]